MLLILRDEFGLIVLPFLFQNLKRRRRIEVVFDGILALPVTMYVLDAESITHSSTT